MSAPLVLERGDFEDGGESYRVVLGGAYLGRVSQMYDGRWVAADLPERHASRDNAIVTLLTRGISV